MKAIFQLYWQICRMRTGPEQVPAVAALAGLTFLVYALLSVVARIGLGELPITYSLASLIAITGFWAGLVYMVLIFKGVANRFQQTFSAAFGTEVILNLLSLPLLFISSRLSEESPLVSLAAVFWMGIFIWDVLIKGFIFHRAFNISPLQGNLFSLMMNFLIMMLDHNLLGYFDPETLKQLEGR